ncbi:DUF2752 domain-containing protein [Leptobacterium flavescens]|uniref:DUF2752 domain-containing protein n=1 Tax=Leptobacterium flavescens TaxID=472055 RepID=A0A6P0ULR8_9FLAO|nr:DUF2752 domain-containing protein [Leptobacterium flavescens]NER14185.1 DUF2752 domain-containing protein [Leptobacterium flavescens]
MLPCLNKRWFGVECPGCGLQRSVAYLFKGDFAAAFYVYPAIYTLILLAGFLFLNLFIKFRYQNIIKISLISLNILIILVSYFIKLHRITN